MFEPYYLLTVSSHYKTKDKNTDFVNLGGEPNIV